jgi:hypothetical protein
VVKTYELPPKPKQQEDSDAHPVREGLKRMGTKTGLTGKTPGPTAESSKMGAASNQPPSNGGAVRRGMGRRGPTWGFGGKNAEAAGKPAADEDDDRRIRFTIDGAGRRLNKEDFLKEMQSLDPKARSEVVAGSDASTGMKAMAEKDAREDIPGSSRLFAAKVLQAGPEKGTATTVGAKMAKERDANIGEESEEGSSRDREERRKAISDSSKGKRETPRSSPGAGRSSNHDSPSSDVPENTVERKRREKALRGTDDASDEQRGRPAAQGDYERGRRGNDNNGSGSGNGSTATKKDREEDVETEAEKRRREAALGVGDGSQEEDSDDDDTPRVPQPVARSRGIRFAQSPVRKKR